MKSKALLGGLLIICGFSTGYAQPDPLDSIIIESKTVYPGMGSPATSVRVWITNKDTLGAVTLLLRENSLSGGAYMTLAWPRNFSGVVGTLTTTLTNYQTFFGNRYNSSSPDSLSIFGMYDPQNRLATVEPPNASRKAFWEIKFDTVRSNLGQIELDTTRIFENWTSFVKPNAEDVKVNFVKGVITVTNPPPPPPPPPCMVVRNLDLNKDGTLTAADLVKLVNCVFAGSSECDGTYTASEVVILVKWIFSESPDQPGC